MGLGVRDISLVLFTVLWDICDVLLFLCYFLPLSERDSNKETRSGRTKAKEHKVPTLTLRAYFTCSLFMQALYN